MKLLFLLPLFLLSGCLSTMGGLVSEDTFENSIALTLACDKTLINSQYGPVGLTSKLRQADHEKIREKFCPKDAAPAPASAASAKK